MTVFNNYLEELKVHSEPHDEIDMDEAVKIEGVMNDHLAHFNKMLRTSSQHQGHERRVAQSSTSSNVLPPPLYYMCSGRLTREIRMGQMVLTCVQCVVLKKLQTANFPVFLCKIVYDVCELIEDSLECKSSEEMRASLKYSVQL